MADGWHIGDWEIPGSRRAESFFESDAFANWGNRVARGSSGAPQPSQYGQAGLWGVTPFAQPGGMNTPPPAAPPKTPPRPPRTPGSMGPSIADWNSAYQNALLSQQAAGAREWAQGESRLQELFGQARDMKIQADFSKLGRAVDQRLADQLYGAGILGGAVDERDIENARRASFDYANLQRGGVAADEGLVRQQYDFIKRALGLAKERTVEARGEARQTRDVNVRGIEGAGTEAGALFSSAVETARGEQETTLARMLRLADNTDAESQLQYDEAFAGLQRKEQDLGAQRRKIDLDLWNKGLELNSAKDRLTIDRKAAEFKKIADDQARAIAAEQDAARLRSFFEQVNRQREAENLNRFYQAVQQQEQARNWANLLAGGAPNVAAIYGKNLAQPTTGAIRGGVSAIAAAARAAAAGRRR